MKKIVLFLFVLFASFANIALATPPGILGCNIGSPCDLDGLVRSMGRERVKTGPFQLGDISVDRFSVESFESDKDGNWLASKINMTLKPSDNWKSDFSKLKKYALDHFHVDSVIQSYESAGSWNYYANINNGYVLYIDAGKGQWSNLTINKGRAQ